MKNEVTPIIKAVVTLAAAPLGLHHPYLNALDLLDRDAVGTSAS
jgi:hypothetical protein